MEPRSWEVRAWGLVAGLTIVVTVWWRSGLASHGRAWAAIATVVVALVVAEALPVARRLLPTPGVLPFVIATSAAAIYGCVPETSDQMPLIGALVIMLIAVEVLYRRQIHIGFHGLVAAMVLWSGIYGATWRQSALIGALFAMWPILIVPAVTLVVRRLTRTAEPVRWLVAGLGMAAALIVARTGALQPTAGPALVAVSVWAGASLVLACGIAAMAPTSSSNSPPAPSNISE